MKTFKSLLKFALSLGIAGFLLWLVFRKLDLHELVGRLLQVNYYWILASIVFSLVSHILRAYRWKLMLEPIGYDVRTSSAFWALMGGYLANLVLPRLGEVTRCALLKKTEEVAFPASFGSVIMERVLDLIMLLGVIVMALLLQFGRISSFFADIVFNKGEDSVSPMWKWILIFIVIFFILSILAWIFSDKIKNTLLYKKIRPLIGELINGILSIRRVKNKPLFFVITFLIWIMYYLMSYIVIFSMEETSGLNPLAGLVILMAGGLGMSAPVQGGIGIYHAFVSNALILYGISYKDGVLFATVLHTSQFIFILIVGAIGLLFSMATGRKKNKNEISPG